MCLVAPKGDPDAADHESVAMDRVLDRPLILPSRPHGVREEVERAALLRRRRPEVVVELDALDQIKALVADGIGCTVLSARYARLGPLAERLEVVSIVCPAIERTISLAHAGDRPLSLAAGAFRTQLLELVGAATADRRWAG